MRRMVARVLTVGINIQDQFYRVLVMMEGMVTIGLMSNIFRFLMNLFGNYMFPFFDIGVARFVCLNPNGTQFFLCGGGGEGIVPVISLHFSLLRSISIECVPSELPVTLTSI